MELYELNGNVGIRILTKNVLGDDANNHIDLIILSTHYTFRFYDKNF